MASMMLLAPGGAQDSNSNRCQADGCMADLSGLKRYFKRYHVCETHIRAPTVLIGGRQVRFCDQCSTFHALNLFDGTRRTCREKLEHNRKKRQLRKESKNTSVAAPAPSSRARGAVPGDSIPRGGAGNQSDDADSADQPGEVGGSSVAPRKRASSIQGQPRRLHPASRHNGGSDLARTTHGAQSGRGSGGLDGSQSPETETEAEADVPDGAGVDWAKLGYPGAASGLPPGVALPGPAAVLAVYPTDVSVGGHNDRPAWPAGGGATADVDGRSNNHIATLPVNMGSSMPGALPYGVPDEKYSAYSGLDAHAVASAGPHGGGETLAADGRLQLLANVTSPSPQTAQGAQPWQLPQPPLPQQYLQPQPQGASAVGGWTMDGADWTRAGTERPAGRPFGGSVPSLQQDPSESPPNAQPGPRTTWPTVNTGMVSGANGFNRNDPMSYLPQTRAPDAWVDPPAAGGGAAADAVAPAALPDMSAMVRMQGPAILGNRPRGVTTGQLDERSVAMYDARMKRRENADMLGNILALGLHGHEVIGDCLTTVMDHDRAAFEVGVSGNGAQSLGERGKLQKRPTDIANKLRQDAGLVPGGLPPSATQAPPWLTQEQGPQPMSFRQYLHPQQQQQHPQQQQQHPQHPPEHPLQQQQLQQQHQAFGSLPGAPTAQSNGLATVGQALQPGFDHPPGPPSAPISDDGLFSEEEFKAAVRGPRASAGSSVYTGDEDAALLANGSVDEAEVNMRGPYPAIRGHTAPNGRRGGQEPDWDALDLMAAGGFEGSAIVRGGGGPEWPQALHPTLTQQTQQHRLPPPHPRLAGPLPPLPEQFPVTDGIRVTYSFQNEVLRLQQMAEMREGRSMAQGAWPAGLAGSPAGQSAPGGLSFTGGAPPPQVATVRPPAQLQPPLPGARPPQNHGPAHFQGQAAAQLGTMRTLPRQPDLYTNGPADKDKSVFSVPVDLDLDDPPLAGAPGAQQTALCQVPASVAGGAGAGAEPYAARLDGLAARLQAAQHHQGVQHPQKAQLQRPQPQFVFTPALGPSNPRVGLGQGGSDEGAGMVAGIGAGTDWAQANCIGGGPAGRGTSQYGGLALSRAGSLGSRGSRGPPTPAAAAVMALMSTSSGAGVGRGPVDSLMGQESGLRHLMSSLEPDPTDDDPVLQPNLSLGLPSGLSGMLSSQSSERIIDEQIQMQMQKQQQQLRAVDPARGPQSLAQQHQQPQQQLQMLLRQVQAGGSGGGAGLGFAAQGQKDLAVGVQQGAPQGTFLGDGHGRGLGLGLGLGKGESFGPAGRFEARAAPGKALPYGNGGAGVGMNWASGSEMPPSTSEWATLQSAHEVQMLQQQQQQGMPAIGRGALRTLQQQPQHQQLNVASAHWDEDAADAAAAMLAPMPSVFSLRTLASVSTSSGGPAMQGSPSQYGAPQYDMSTRMPPGCGPDSSGGGGHGRLSHLAIKMSHPRPETLPADLAERMQGRLRDTAAAALPPTIREGCIELLVEVLHSCPAAQLCDQLFCLPDLDFDTPPGTRAYAARAARERLRDLLGAATFDSCERVTLQLLGGPVLSCHAGCEPELLEWREALSEAGLPATASTWSDLLLLQSGPPVLVAKPWGSPDVVVFAPPELSEHLSFVKLVARMAGGSKSFGQVRVRKHSGPQTPTATAAAAAFNPAATAEGPPAWTVIRSHQGGQGQGCPPGQSSPGPGVGTEEPLKTQEQGSARASGDPVITATELLQTPSASADGNPSTARTGPTGSAYSGVPSRGLLGTASAVSAAAMSQSSRRAAAVATTGGGLQPHGKPTDGKRTLAGIMAMLASSGGGSGEDKAGTLGATATEAAAACAPGTVSHAPQRSLGALQVRTDASGPQSAGTAAQPLARRTDRVLRGGEGIAGGVPAGDEASVGEVEVFPLEASQQAVEVDPAEPLRLEMAGEPEACGCAGGSPLRAVTSRTDAPAAEAAGQPPLQRFGSPSSHQSVMARGRSNAATIAKPAESSLRSLAADPPATLRALGTAVSVAAVPGRGATTVANCSAADTALATRTSGHSSATLTIASLCGRLSLRSDWSSDGAASTAIFSTAGGNGALSSTASFCTAASSIGAASGATLFRDNGMLQRPASGRSRGPTSGADMRLVDLGSSSSNIVREPRRMVSGNRALAYAWGLGVGSPEGAASPNQPGSSSASLSNSGSGQHVAATTSAPESEGQAQPRGSGGGAPASFVPGYPLLVEPRRKRAGRARRVRRGLALAVGISAVAAAAGVGDGAAGAAAPGAPMPRLLPGRGDAYGAIRGSGGRSGSSGRCILGRASARPVLLHLQLPALSLLRPGLVLLEATADHFVPACWPLLVVETAQQQAELGMLWQELGLAGQQEVWRSLAVDLGLVLAHLPRRAAASEKMIVMPLHPSLPLLETPAMAEAEAAAQVQLHKRPEQPKHPAAVAVTAVAAAAAAAAAAEASLDAPSGAVSSNAWSYHRSWGTDIANSSSRESQGSDPATCPLSTSNASTASERLLALPLRRLPSPMLPTAVAVGARTESGPESGGFGAGAVESTTSASSTTSSRGPSGSGHGNTTTHAVSKRSGLRTLVRLVTSAASALVGGSASGGVGTGGQRSAAAGKPHVSAPSSGAPVDGATSGPRPSRHLPAALSLLPPASLLVPPPAIETPPGARPDGAAALPDLATAGDSGLAAARAVAVSPLHGTRRRDPPQHRVSEREIADLTGALACVRLGAETDRPTDLSGLAQPLPVLSPSGTVAATEAAGAPLAPQTGSCEDRQRQQEPQPPSELQPHTGREAESGGQQSTELVLPGGPARLSEEAVAALREAVERLRVFMAARSLPALSELVSRVVEVAAGVPLLSGPAMAQLSAS